MEVTDDVLTAMFAAWREDIDSVSFAHEAACEEIIRTLLGAAHPSGGRSEECVE